MIIYVTSPSFIHSDLLNEVSLEGDILTCFARKGYREDVSQSLCLMDDGVGEGQVLPVLNLHLTTS